MTRKIHHLVAATDNRTLTRLTNIYAATFEEAWREAEHWQQEHCPELPSLSVTVQPQGFRTCFTCLPGYIDEEDDIASMKRAECCATFVASKESKQL